MNNPEQHTSPLDLHIERVANFQKTLQAQVDNQILPVRARGFGLQEQDQAYSPAAITIDDYHDFPIETAINNFSKYDLRPHRLYLAESAGALATKNLVFGPMVTARKRSAHGVFFGTLESEEVSMEVAVKPHETKNFIASCLKDYISNIFISELGLPNLPPVGFMIDYDRAYSLTKLDKRITTLDSSDWTKLYPDPTANPGMLQILSQLSRQAAMLHSYGIASHGDMAGRNAAVREDDTAFWIDWEHLLVRSHESPDAKARLGLSLIDVASFAESLALPPDAVEKSGLGAFMGAGDWHQAFCDVFFNEYRATRMNFANQTKISQEERNAITIEMDVLEHRVKELVTIIQSNVI